MSAVPTSVSVARARRRTFRVLTKPCDREELRRACAAARGQHRLRPSERVLLQEPLRGSVDGLAVEVAACSRTSAR
jgi:hypothetical protein